MTVTYGFYNSLNHDRVYDSVQISRLFDGIIGDGIFATIGTSLMVVPKSGLSVDVGIGKAWFNHTWTENDAILPLTLDIPHPTLPRIDAIILEVNDAIEVRVNSIKVKKGTPATVPTAPAMTNTDTLHQYALAYISMSVGLTVITSYQIENRVGKSATPFVSGPAALVNTDEMLAQWEAEFGLWFQEMKDQLGTDAAGHLQNEIDDIKDLELRVVGRQGHATDPEWVVVGSTNYTPEKASIQMGSYLCNTSLHVITFPLPFVRVPIVFVQANSATGYRITAEVVDFTLNNFTVLLTRHLDVAPYHQAYTGMCPILWLAVGPMA